MASGSAQRGRSAAAHWPARAGGWVRAWSRALATAIGAGAIAGAAQLGVAYGLGLLRPARTFPADGSWSTQLTWMAWCAALAVLAGAGGGTWTARRHGQAHHPGTRIVVALAAGAGAAVVVPLTAIPARAAELGNAATVPALDATLAAGLGVVVGVLASVAVLSARLVASTVTLLVSAVWLLALVSVAPSLGREAALPEVRLGVLDLPGLRDGAGSTVALLSAPVVVLLACGAVAVAARSRGLPPLTIAAAGAVAPGLLALVYLIGSPGTGDRTVQASPYAGSLIAVAAGLLVATVVAVVRTPGASGRDDGSGGALAGGGPADTGPDPAGAAPGPRQTTHPEPAGPRPKRAKAPPSGPVPPPGPVVPPQPGPSTPRSRTRRSKGPEPTGKEGPPEQAAPPEPPATPAGPPAEPASAEARWGRRHRDDDHFDWITSLSTMPGDGDLSAAPGKPPRKPRRKPRRDPP